MSEKKQELTYILGAGASYQSIPVVKTFNKRFDNLLFEASSHNCSKHKIIQSVVSFKSK